jgi:DNA-binding beta-propeller fold protein YncE
MKSTVAHIEFQSDRTILTQLEKNKTIGTLTEPRKTTRKVLQAKGQHPYFVNIKVNSDEDNCYITSACCMEDGMIILADDNNKKLKKLHSQNYTVIDYCDLLEAPWQVCVINKAQVAVTVPSQKEVQFISIETPMEAIKKINTDFACYGIAYANSHIYISDDTSVYMCTMSARKVKRFSIDQSIRTILSDIFSPFFSKPSCGIYSIAVSKDATRIYVANADNGLIVLDNNGRVIKIFNGQQLKWANCCYLTEAGSVLVSGENSNNVLQFTSDGELIGEVIKANSGERRIRSICCNQQMSKMCICRLTDNNIEMYNI